MALDDGLIPPASVVTADAFPGSYDAEACGLMKCNAGRIFREDAGLNGPDPGCLSRGDEGVQELAADALAAAR